MNIRSLVLALAATLALGACDELDSLINSALVESVSVSPDTATLGVGEALQLTAQLKDAAGNALLRRPEWRSADPAVVSVDSLGRVLAVGSGIGRVEASADGRADVTQIRVVPRVAAVSISSDSLSLSVGETYQLGVSLRDRLGAPVAVAAVAWRSTEPGVVSVDAAGRVQGLRVGAARVIAETEAASDTALVRVFPLVGRVELVPDTATLGEGESLLLGATLYDRNGEPLADVLPTWRTTEPGVVSLEPTGRVRALAVGVTRVIAQSGAIADTATLRVVPRVASVGISPDTVTVRIGQQYQLGATLRDYRGLLLPNTFPAWRSIEPEVATVDQEGRVTGVAAGSARIVAATPYAADTARVRVVAPPPPAQPTTPSPSAAPARSGRPAVLPAAPPAKARRR